jgi:hypothetical protein
MNKFEQFYESVMDDYRKEMNIPSKKTLSPDEYEELSFLFKLVKDSKEILISPSAQNVYDANKPNLAIKELEQQMKKELAAVADDLKRIELVGTSKEDKEALPQNPKIASINYEANKRPNTK